MRHTKKPKENSEDARKSWCLVRSKRYPLIRVSKDLIQNTQPAPKQQPLKALILPTCYPALCTLSFDSLRVLWSIMCVCANILCLCV